MLMPVTKLSTAFRSLGENMSDHFVLCFNGDRDSSAEVSFRLEEAPTST